MYRWEMGGNKTIGDNILTYRDVPECSRCGQASLPDVQKEVAVRPSKLSKHTRYSGNVVVRRTYEAKYALHGVLPVQSVCKRSHG